MNTLIDVKNLCIDFKQGNRLLRAVDHCSFSIAPGEMLALVGESGSGKSVTALSLMGLLPRPAGIVSEGNVLFQGKELLSLPEEELNALRGNRISMIFQEPMTALNPVLTVGWQVAEILRQHTELSKASCEAEAISLLEKVGIPDAARRAQEYQHQMSGGMRQRVMIAMALACKPDFIIADEPTTALDVTVQAQIMELLDSLRRETGTAILLITHNLALVRQKADRVAVMYAGTIVECAPCEELFRSPSHPYTRLLLASIPSAASRGIPLQTIAGQVPAPGTHLPGCRFQPRCPYAGPECEREAPSCTNIGNDALPHLVHCHRSPLPPMAISNERHSQEETQEAPLPLLRIENLHLHFPVRTSLFGKPVWLKAVNDVSLTLRRGESLALVGESGCGKTTLGRSIIRLLQPTSGSIFLDTSPNLATLSEKELKPYRRRMAMVFQDPFSSLDPRMMVEDTIAEGLDAYGLHQKDRRRYLEELSAKVGLSPDFLKRYPHQFSGGQRQRIGLARALALQPELVICDECTSALDVSVQAQILNLLIELKHTLGLSYLFITHDLSVVSYIADRIAIMYLGQIVEEGTASEILGHAAHPYTQCLLASAPTIEGTAPSSPAIQGELPSPLSPPEGCPFHPRCPHADEACRQMPPWHNLSSTHRCRCARIPRK